MMVFTGFGVGVHPVFLVGCLKCFPSVGGMKISASWFCKKVSASSWLSQRVPCLMDKYLVVKWHTFLRNAASVFTGFISPGRVACSPVYSEWMVTVPASLSLWKLMVYSS